MTRKPSFRLALPLAGLCLAASHARALDLYSLAGNWELDPSRSDSLETAIQACLRGLDPNVQPMARNRLLATNARKPRLVITPAEGGHKVRIVTDTAGEPSPFAPVDGTPSEASNRERGEAFRRRLQLLPDRLLETYEAEDGRRQNAYRTSGDERSLQVDVTVESGYLPRPLQYRLTYRLRSRPRS